jgi:hypothetical protein
MKDYYAPFPSHDIDPRLKDRGWCLQFCKAAWYENDKMMPGKLFYRSQSKYDERKLYALGMQPIYKYKKAMGVDEQTNTTWLNIDFQILPIVKNRRQIAVSKLNKAGYNIVATPVDPIAKTEMDRYYADVKAKIMLRDMLAKMQPELADSPQLMPEANEPQDLEELEMQMEYGYKHNMALQSELGIKVVFEQNNIEAVINKWDADLFDDGVAAAKDWTDANGRIQFRDCDTRCIITNYCRYWDFRDMVYCGEVLTMTMNDLKKEAGDTFTLSQYEEMAYANKGKYNNPFTYIAGSYDSDKFKVKVLDLEWFSVDEHVYEMRVNKQGNLMVGKTDYNDRNNVKEKYKRKKVKMVYKAKWIIGTDYIYDFGIANYIKRDKSNPAECRLNYHIAATNFYEMTAKGVMEDLMPIADQVQIAWLKLQNIRNQLLPFLIEIDLTALENIAYGKGGQAMSPKEIIEMMFQTGILISRRAELMTGNNNYKSVEYIQTNYGEAISEAWNDLTANINLIREATGFNDLTDGSTPNPKTLTTPAEMAYESTNNALYNLVFARKQLLLSLARGVFTRLQQVLKEGQVQGYIHSLGTNAIKFIQVDPDVSLYDMAIVLEDKPNAEQKLRLQQHLAESMARGELDITDAIIIENTQNIKQAEQLLAFKIKKRRDQMQQEALQLQQANTETQIQSAQAAEQAKQQTLQLEWALKTQYMREEMTLQKDIKAMELAAKQEINRETLESKEVVQEMSNQAKAAAPASK